MSRSIVVLTLFIAWALFLLLLMEAIRAYLVTTGLRRANGHRGVLGLGAARLADAYVDSSPRSTSSSSRDRVG